MTFPFSALPKKTLCAIAWCRISFGRMKKRPQQNNPYRKDLAYGKIRVIITNNQKAVKVPTGVRMLIRRCCHAVLRMEKFEDSAEISVTFVDNEQIRELNAQYPQQRLPQQTCSLSPWVRTACMTSTTIPARRFSATLYSLWKWQWRRQSATATA